MIASEKKLVDQEQRERAIDPSISAIVQAPAGSGKTELLIQRYLALLATVNDPEEILAITFTRKAAGEMRDRILKALEQAANNSEPDEVHAKVTWRLASSVLKRDQEKNWSISENSDRLRVQTIDSLSAWLVRQAPLLSGFGSIPSIAEDSAPLYREAARALLQEVSGEKSGDEPVSMLLAHLGNDLKKAELLLIQMMAKRDQWLRHLVGKGGVEEVEIGLFHLAEEVLSELNRCFSPQSKDEWFSLARFAAVNLADEDGENPLQILFDCESFPEAAPAELKKWLALIELLLTKSGGWRKTVNKNIGFPTGPVGGTDSSVEKKRFKEKKEHWKALKNSLENDRLLALLQAVRALPGICYGDQQRKILTVLFNLLPRAVAHLQLVFQTHGETDFSEIAMRANRTLGTGEEPSELALRLDYRISHILMDEFQDTSQSQVELLEKLTVGWEVNDGRTLFLVGDPMQSIYQFREAEVGLFLKARKEGIGQVRLEPLQLKVNFRSQAGLVDWFNDSFRQVFPVREELSKGAVSFSPSASWKGAENCKAVEVMPIIGRDDRQEAKWVVENISRLRQQSGESIAVLVRSKRHIESIALELRNQGVRFRAVEIEPLGERQVVQDLVAITRALLHPADRVSWLALLRAPWCGLSLKDFSTLFENRKERNVLQLIENKDNLQIISTDGRARLARVVPVFSEAVENRLRRPLRQMVEAVWFALSGPAFLTEKADLEAAKVFLEGLGSIEEGGDLADLRRLDELLERLYSPPDPEADESLQLMTIHKSKGLEFEHVFLPGLGKIPRGDNGRLLYWMERPRAGQPVPDLLLGPVGEAGGKKDPVAEFIKNEEKEKSSREIDRLLYVAATRAQKSLFLSGHVEIRESSGEIIPPSGQTLLGRLWPVVVPEFEAALTSVNSDPGPVIHQSGSVPLLKRVRLDWKADELPKSFSIGRAVEQTESELEQPEFVWAGETARHVGVVVHAMLEKIGNEGVEHWNEEKLILQRGLVSSLLLRSGVGLSDQDVSVEQVIRLLIQTVNDEKGRWVLSSRHQQVECEKAMTGIWRDKFRTIVIDRTFVDEKGVRWIIDYKTGAHEGSDIDQFLQNEKVRYKPQLDRYAEMMRSISPEPIKLGLYFPALSKWLEWDDCRL